MSLEFHNPKNNKRKTLVLKVIVVILAILTLFAIKASYGAYQKERDSSEKLGQVMSDYQKLQARAVSLSEGMSELETERGKEANIRDKFRVAKEGEKVIFVLDTENTDDTIIEKPLPWWKKMFLWW